MILDTLGRHARYTTWMPSLAPAFAFLRQCATPSLAPGRYDIEGDNIYAIVARYPTRDFHSAQPEAHRRYLDVQYLIAGRETIYWTPLEEAAAPATEYDYDRDIIFFARGGGERPFELAAGDFVIFLPDDVHEPNCHAGTPGQVHKVVVKVRV